MKKLDELLDKILSIITVACYMLMIIAVLMQIAARYIPSLTLSWTEELTRFFFIFIICLGAPLSLKYASYADVDLFYVKFPRSVKKIVYLLIYISITIFTIVVILSGYRFILIGTTSVSPALKWPKFIHHSSVFLFGIFTLIYSILKLVYFAQDSDKAISQYDNLEVPNE